QGSASALPTSQVKNAIPVTQTLFQVSEQHFSEAFSSYQGERTFTSKAFSSSPSVIGVMCNDCAISNNDHVAIESSTASAHVKEMELRTLDDKPTLAPILMMTYLNNCMSNIKSTLNTNGLPIGIDANGRAQARAKMEDARDFQKNSSSGSTAKSSCTAASKDYGIICTSATALPTISLYSVPSQASVQPEINQIDAKIFFAETINVADGNDLESPPEKRMLIASEVELL
ncbi:hypothetical protein V3C99_018040, partial [Haemonchus contortus]